jgi:hypothetical protein
MGNIMIGNCSSAGRNLKTKKSSTAGKTLATTCKTKKTATKPVVKKAAPKPVVKKSPVMVKPKLDNSKSLKIEDLVGKKLTIEIGSAKYIDTFTKDELIKKIKEALMKDLFNYDFYYNYTSSDTKSEYMKLYKETVIDSLMKNINKTLNDWFEIKDARFNPVSNSNLLLVKENNNFDKVSDKWFMKTRISDKLRNEYKAYRKKQFSVIL